ncbi:MAG: NAD(P)/FAD-dependent oxidoreductase [Deltaproteobacteria bacterium]|nr:NAD(P)/FAD-dependent oxidoreductase [Deltaproteobacteria bacterium]MBW2008726.1 NAD(P)/FAD-dependent oxidoreductase [Deltaproteobacteria bacterium]
MVLAGTVTHNEERGPARPPGDPQVLVVGAGPAGCSAARAAAEAGVRVLVVERKAVVGEPVRCGEYVPAPLLREVGRGGAFVVQPVKGMRTILPSGEVHTLRAPGFIIRRRRFDQVLAAGARDAGAHILLSTRAVMGEEGCVRLLGASGEEWTVKPRVVIGADGPHSSVGRRMGIRNRNLLAAVQVRVPLVRPMDHTEVHFLPEIFGGYGWLFPRGGQANVGLGMAPGHGGPHALRPLLGSLLGRLAGEGKIRNTPRSLTAGWIPVRPLERTVRGWTLLAGDAAGQTHSITGAGVAQAVECGRMAGKWAARAVLEDRASALAGYESGWRDLFGETLERAWEKRKHLEARWDRLEEVIRSCWVGFREYYA